MRKKAALRVSLVCLALLAGACDDGYCDEPVSGPVTYTQRVKPILAQHCNRCHASTLPPLARHGATPGVDYDSYADAVARSNAARGLYRTRAGTMPPEGKIPSSECAALRAWVEQGTPE